MLLKNYSHRNLWESFFIVKYIKVYGGETPSIDLVDVYYVIENIKIISIADEIKSYIKYPKGSITISLDAWYLEIIRF